MHAAAPSSLATGNPATVLLRRPLPPTPLVDSSMTSTTYQQQYQQQQQQQQQQQLPPVLPPRTATMLETDNDDDPNAVAVVTCGWTDCNLVFDDPENLYLHLTNDHIGRKQAGNLCLRCAWRVPDPDGPPGALVECGIAKAKRDHITSHLRVHVPLFRHQCAACSKRFKRPQDLKKHERIHELHESAGDGGAPPTIRGSAPALPPRSGHPLHLPQHTHVSPPLGSSPTGSLAAYPMTNGGVSGGGSPVYGYTHSHSHSPHAAGVQAAGGMYLASPGVGGGPMYPQQHSGAAYPISPMTPSAYATPGGVTGGQFFTPSFSASSDTATPSPVTLYGMASTRHPSPLAAPMSLSDWAATSGHGGGGGGGHYDGGSTHSGGSSDMYLSAPPNPHYQHHHMYAPSPPAPATVGPSVGGPVDMMAMLGGGASVGGSAASSFGGFDNSAYLAPARKRKADMDDMDELDVFLEGVKRARIAPVYDAHLAMSLDSLTPGLLSGNLLQTPLLSTMPESDGAALGAFLAQLEEHVVACDPNVPALLDAMDHWRGQPLAMTPFAAMGAPQMAPPASMMSAAPPAPAASAPAPSQRSHRHHGRHGLAKSISPPPASAATSLGAAIGLPGATLPNALASVPSAAAVSAPPPGGTASSSSRRGSKDAGKVLELHNVSRKGSEAARREAKEAKEAKERAARDRTAAAAAAAAAAAEEDRALKLAIEASKREAKDAKKRERHERHQREKAAASSGNNSSSSAIKRARSPIPPQHRQQPLHSSSSTALDPPLFPDDLLANAMSSMSITDPAAPAPYRRPVHGAGTRPMIAVDPQVERAAYHVMAIRALRQALVGAPGQ